MMKKTEGQKSRDTVALKTYANGVATLLSLSLKKLTPPSAA
jgi:hypothetical protein